MFHDWRKIASQCDLELLTAVLVLAGAGIVTLAHLGQASPEGTPYGVRQGLWLGLGLVAMVLAMLPDYRTWLRFSRWLYAASLIPLFLLPFIGRAIGGSKSWIVMGGFRFQPSEAAKIAAILMAASYLASNEEREFTAKKFAILAVIFGVPSILSAVQPDFGTALTFVPLFGVYLWVAGAGKRWFFGMAGAALAAFPAAWFFVFKDYQKARILTFLDPMSDPQGNGYQILQSQIAIGAGGFFGRGFEKSTQSLLEFVPAQHTDFVFSAFAETWGLAGVVVLLGAYAFVLIRMLTLAQRSKDAPGFFIGVGIFMMVAFQVLLNLGMAVGFFPITGLPLPWMSYGGSSLLMNFVGLGLVLSIGMRRFVN